MRLTSTSFSPGGELAQRHGKRSENVSPQLAWDEVPDSTRSFALSLVDVHPVARGYVHWMLVDLPRDTRELVEGEASAGLPGATRELVPYVGPFPPSGVHPYVFTLSALSVEVAPIQGRPSAAQWEKALGGVTIGSASLSCLFRRA